ncbi:hypothetical protein CARUB_v10006176mg [Capsella rubella]|uniref:Uncharacterized protein n=1 Tax=Capsella rubella TaxID=81985 RepID=R0F7B8_9BRAS|nr:hypothetical protein CARUB_v10006176mg [Capsella rubella]
MTRASSATSLSSSPSWLSFPPRYFSSATSLASLSSSSGSCSIFLMLSIITSYYQKNMFHVKLHITFEA